MNGYELDLKGETDFYLTYFGNRYNKKETSGNDYLMLIGALVCFCENNADLLNELGMSMSEIIGGAAMQGSELYLNSFEGYYLNDRLILRTLYLNEYNKIIWSVYDSKKDRYIDFV